MYCHERKGIVPVVMCCSYGPVWEREVPYNISMVKLEEGVRIWSNVVGSPPEEVKIGDPVVITYDDVTEDATPTEVSPRSMKRTKWMSKP